MANLNETAKTNTRKTVVIACKLPNGILLSVPKGAPYEEQTRIKLMGNSVYTLPNEDRKWTMPTLAEGHSLTTISSDFWEQWVSENKDTCTPFKRGFFFAANSVSEATAKAADNRENLTGLERLDPKKNGVQPLKAED